MPATNFGLEEVRYTLRDNAGIAESYTISFAFVQWEQGYNPKYHPLSEWTNNPISVNWAGTYQPLSGIEGAGRFSAWTTFNFDSPVYLFIQLSQSNQVWMGQISDILILDGQPQTFNLSSGNIKSVVGSFDGTSMYAADWNSWQPQAVPEPSYAGLIGLLFVSAIVYKKYA